MAKFKPGESGNPSGRSTGTATKVSKLRALLEPHAQPLIEKCVALAKDGDTTALRLCLERLLPALKPQALPISLPVNGSLAGQGDEIIKATMAGHIPPDIGSQLITALAAQAKLIEIDQLTRRVEALENNA